MAKFLNTYLQIINQFTMKKLTLGFFSILSISLLTSCEAVNTIFKAGMWWAFILIFGGVALIIWLISKFMGGNKK